LKVDEAAPVTEVISPIVTVSFVTPVSLAVFFDVSTDDGVDVGVEPPDVEVAEPSWPRPRQSSLRTPACPTSCSSCCRRRRQQGPQCTTTRLISFA